VLSFNLIFFNILICFDRSLDVLDLIAKVLSFTDEQKVAVGLKVGPINIFTSILTNVIGVTPAKEPIDVEVSVIVV
jgi:hypothetical protein